MRHLLFIIALLISFSGRAQTFGNAYFKSTHIINSDSTHGELNGTEYINSAGLFRYKENGVWKYRAASTSDLSGLWPLNTSATQTGHTSITTAGGQVMTFGDSEFTGGWSLSNPSASDFLVITNNAFSVSGTDFSFTPGNGTFNFSASSSTGGFADQSVVNFDIGGNGDPLNFSDGDFWYNPVTDLYKGRAAGTTVSFGSGGLTNSAANNELMKSNGTNAVPSGLFSTLDGNLILGSTALAGTGTISAVNATGNASIILQPEGTGTLDIKVSSLLNLGTGVAGTQKIIQAAGSATDITLGLYSKGSGNVQIGMGVGGYIYGFGISNATNTVNNALRLNHRTLDTPATGIGVGVEFETHTSGAGNYEIGSVIQSVTTDVTAGSEDFDLVVKNMAAGAAAAEKFRITSAGNATLVGTGTGVDWVATSDRRLKHHFKPASSQLDKISRMADIVTNYDRKDSGKNETGFIAQELLKVAQEYVVTPVDTASGYYSVNYAKMTPILVKGVDELSEEVSQLKKEVAELKAVIKQYITLEASRK